MYDYEDYIEHHGIKGQRWGVRRFQNADGTRTAAGKRREREDYDDAQNDRSGSSIDKAKIAKGAAVAGAVALGAVLIANPSSRNVLTKYGKTAMATLTSDKTKEAVKNAASNAGKKVGERVSKVGDAMLDAALVSAGGIAITKLSKELQTDENASEFEQNRNKMILDTASAGIKAATGANGGSSNNSNNGKGGSVGKEVSDKVGAPSNKGIDRSSTQYQNLFKDKNGNQRSPEERSTIKSMASAGYDIDQIDKYLNHSALKEWADSFTYYRAIGI